ncbi:MAG: PAS domain S-box protein [Rhodospirillaceae bacterium]|nr:PAS domain S-box protein [Rhodospirillaceae bacterium]
MAKTNIGPEATVVKGVMGSADIVEDKDIPVLLHGEKRLFWTIDRVIAAMGVLMGVVLIGMVWWRQHALVRMNRSLRESERRFKDFADVSSDWYWEMDADLRYSYVSQRYEDITGLKVSERLGARRWDRALQEDSEASWAAHKADVEARRAFRNFEFTIPGPGGATIYVSASGVPVFDDASVFTGYRGSTTDITERKQAEIAIQDSKKRFMTLVDASAAAISLKDKDGHYLLVNKTFSDWAESNPGELVGKTLHDTNPPEDAEQIECADQKVIETGESLVYTAVRGFNTNRIQNLVIHKVPIFDASGDVIAIATTAFDVTQLKTAERALAEREALLRSIIDNCPSPILVKDQDRVLQIVNRAFEYTHGYPARDIIGQTVTSMVDSDADMAIKNHELHVLESGEASSEERAVVLQNGAHLDHIVTKFPIRDQIGAITGVGTIMTDISERKRLEARQQRLAVAVEEMSELLAIYDSDDCLVICNKGYLDSLSLLPEESVLGRTFEENLRVSVERNQIPEARGQEEQWVRNRIEKHQNPGDPFVVNRLDGKWFQVSEQRLPDGGIIMLATDISERKGIEDQLRQAQRMEAVGQLTGGVAHDFNNLLFVMLGNAEMLEFEISGDDAAQTKVEAIKLAVKRASSLTQRLLAFSRQQALSPVSANVSSLIDGLEEMLGRTLGETIELKIEPATDLWPASIDPHQFENALVNLAINARDAMPKGGSLNISTANVTLDKAFAARHEEVTPGDYVKVSVGDTGVGMTPEVLTKVFEPFFTTKDIGAGSGLGLSMVYGFVKQSEGHITIDSEVDHGATINLYLPRSLEIIERRGITSDPTEFAPRFERILVIEDDPNVRQVPVSILRDQGYDVVEAETGAAAISCMTEGAAFDLLFTDIVLPGGMNGVEIAAEAKRLQPGIKVLYATGYADNTVFHQGQIDADAILLSKPYLRTELLEKVSATLDT